MNNFDIPKRLAALQSLASDLAQKGYEVKVVGDQGDIMGDLSGLQFDSEMQGGYVYFWSTGIVGRQLLDYDNSNEIIEDATGEMTDEELVQMLKVLAEKL